MMDVALCYDVALETTVENKVSTIFDEYCHVDHAEEANFDDGGYEQNEDVPECITAITVRHRQNQQVNVGVSVFENSSDLCSCRYETNKGSVCRHFLAAFLELQTPKYAMSVGYKRAPTEHDYANLWPAMNEKAESL